VFRGGKEWNRVLEPPASSAERRLIVTYDAGAAPPMELAAALRPLGELTFVVHPAEPLRPLLAELGQVLELTGDRRLSDRLVEDLVRWQPDGIVTFSERCLEITGQLAERLGLLFHPGPVVRGLTHKPTQRALLADAGVDGTRFVEITAAEQWPAAAAEVGLPCVLKPARGEGSRNTLRIDDLTEGARASTDLLAGSEPALLVEELLVGRDNRPFGDYVSVESIVVNGRPQHLAVTGKLPLVPPFRETCAFWPAPVSGDERSRLFELTEAALTALSVANGLTHTEIKLTEDGPRIIEVNGRLGGYIADLARRAAGLDLLATAGRIALGLPVEPAPPPGLDRTTFVFSNLPPAGARRLLSVSGSAAVRAIPGVTSYRPLFTPRRLIRGGFGTEELDLLRGSCAGPDDLVALCRAAQAELCFDFEMAPDGAVQTFAATELPSWQALA
jgi:hypothetical protein